MVIDYLFHVVHAAITDLDGVSVEDFSELVIFGKVLVCVGPFPSVGLTLTWFIWDRNLALHITLYSVDSV